MKNSSLLSGFLGSGRKFPDRLAVEVGKEARTYADLQALAASIAATLRDGDTASAQSTGPALTAVFAYRSITAFAGVLAALMRGHGYVPLNRTFPAQRSQLMLERSGCREIIVDADSEDQLSTLLSGIKTPMTLILPDRDDVSDLQDRWPVHRVVGRQGLATPMTVFAEEIEPDALAYVLFTSGSTGVPKGVMVSQANVSAFLDIVLDRYEISEHDRFSQMFDMTFDLSVFDMFVSWARGACVCCPTQKELFMPSRFIKDAKLTFWFSVPSTANIMKELGMLRPGKYPNLRHSLFCGEALNESIAEAWSEAAPNSIIENLYGPTELTIACAAYRWDRDRSRDECRMGLVPIGEPFESMTALVVDDELNPVEAHEDGQLIMSGPQVTLGYLDDEAKTRSAFVRPPLSEQVHYCTGDRVVLDPSSGLLHFRGRTDQQVKILGHRVELGEVEAAIRKEAEAEAAVAIAWPTASASAEGIVGFVQSPRRDLDQVLERLGSRLPAYMVPSRLHALESFPLNVNGKIDRAALRRMAD